jgi:hypothetical protein
VCVRARVQGRMFSVHDNGITIQFRLSTKIATKIKFAYDHHDLCVKR